MYTIKKTAQAPPLNGDPGHPAWAAAQVLHIDTFPWYIKGKKQDTEVRVLYSPDALHLLFMAEDTHSSAAVTELNGPVCTDSCVEFFATARPDMSPDYFNLEINCCGTLLGGFGPDRHHRTAISAEGASRIGIYHSVPGPVKAESPEDDGWEIEAAVPFSVLAEFAGVPAPGSGTVWKVNFYRIGGVTDPQFGVWADIKWKKPDFHRPEFFREVSFE